MDVRVARYSTAILLVSALVLATSLSSCAMGETGATGAVTIALDRSALGLSSATATGSGKMVLPPFSALYYSLTLTNPSCDQSPIEVTNTTGAAFSVAGVPVGNWTATVSAIDSGTVYAKGTSTSFAVSSGGGSATVKLDPVAGMGRIIVQVNWTSGLVDGGSGVSCIYSANADFSSPTSIAQIGYSSTGANYATTYIPYDVPAGVYMLKVSVTSTTGQKYQNVESVLVAAGLASSKTIALTASDFGTDASVQALETDIISDGQYHPILVRWTASGADSLALERTLDNGATWTRIASTAEGSLPATATSFLDYGPYFFGESTEDRDYRLTAMGRNGSSSTMATTNHVTFISLMLKDAGSATNFSMGYAGVAELPHTVASITGFSIAKTEVTYAQWYLVKKWAESRGSGAYAFAQSGREGHDGTPGAPPTAGINEPATNISWRSAMVWCNALSEYTGRAPCYYSDAGFSSPLRSSTDDASIDLTAGSQDSPYVKWTANGYRLPTEAEWELAARYIDGYSWTQGDWASGADGSTLLAGDVAWYSANAGSATHDVAAKAADKLGLYDMSGNVAEWCFDWYGGAYVDASPYTDADTAGAASPASSGRVIRGGSYSSTTEVESSARSSYDAYNGWTTIGFRVCRR